MSRPLVISQIFGGLGNQLFCYAAARRLAAKNGVPLKLDISSGFQHDRYKREYLLDSFNVQAEVADHRESYTDRFGPFRRRLSFHFNRLLAFERRSYLFEEFPSFDSRLVEHRVRRQTYLSGYWQSDLYFRDIEDMLRHDLLVTIPFSAETVSTAGQIHACNTVSVHIRSYGEVPADRGTTILTPDYYHHAAKVIADRISDPHFFCFSDDPCWVETNLRLPYPLTVVRCNNSKGNVGAVEDLWLMSQCQHHIIANSTFSWWGAWLSTAPGKIVVGPIDGIVITNKDWLPSKWLRI